MGRKSIAVRDRLWARAMAVEQNGQRIVIVSCDLVSTTLEMTHHVREMVTEQTGVTEDAIMVASTHTHSGPATGSYVGWGEVDETYIKTLPTLIAKACIDACDHLQGAEFFHALVPCEGIGINREYEAAPLSMDEPLKEDWRPRRPQLTDTTCHVISVRAQGKLLGFVSYFGCHPVVCCEDTHHIHGDFCGVANNQIQEDHPGSVGLFLQGAHGDVNTCIAHMQEEQSLIALDSIARRYARVLQEGIEQAKPIAVDRIEYCTRPITFSLKDWGLKKLQKMLLENEEKLRASDLAATTANDISFYVTSLERLIAKVKAGHPIAKPTEIQGIRIGPLVVLGSGLEASQAIKNDIVSKAAGPTTLVASMINDGLGYAVDKAVADRGGYAAQTAPFICGMIPYSNAAEELTDALLDLDQALH